MENIKAWLLIGFYIALLVAPIAYNIISRKKHKERQAAIKRYAQDYGLKYIEYVNAFPASGHFKMDEGSDEKFYQALLKGETYGINFCTFDHILVIRSGNVRDRRGRTVCLLSAKNVEFPDFYIREEDILDAEKLSGGQDINFKDDPKFSKKFLLQGKSELNIRKFFSAKIRKVFLENHKKGYIYEAHGKTFAVSVNGYATPAQRSNIVAECVNLYKQLIPSDQQTLG